MSIAGFPGISREFKLPMVDQVNQNLLDAAKSGDVEKLRVLVLFAACGRYASVVELGWAGVAQDGSRRKASRRVRPHKPGCVVQF